MQTANQTTGLSDAVLKHLAYLTLLIDHAGLFLLPIMNLPADHKDMIILLFRICGRLCFPLFAFLIAEGAAHTGNSRNYLLRLLLLGAWSIFPYRLLHTVSGVPVTSWNIGFTLAMGLLCVLGMKQCRAQIRQTACHEAVSVLWVLICCLFAEHIHLMYGAYGVLLIVGLYLYRKQPLMTALCMTALTIFGLPFHAILSMGILPWIAAYGAHPVHRLLQTQLLQACGIFALPLLLWTDGRKGRQGPQWLYYSIYPLHFLLYAAIIWLL